MIKTILVPAAGSEIDEAVFATALAAARSFAAHLEFLHVHVDAAEAARYTPHLEFARGPGIAGALQYLEVEAKTRSTHALRHFQEFCTRRAIEITDEPGARDRVSANWREQGGDSLRAIMERARHNDLTILGRRRHPDGLPPDLIELLLLGCGRPVMIAAGEPPRALMETIMICWKQAPEAARAVAFAMPFLEQAKRVVIGNVEEHNRNAADAVHDLARELAWHGIRAETRCIPAKGRATAELLSVAAGQCDADLVVMGGLGHNRLREMIFGGCAQFFLQESNACLLVAH
jgi:nucleotide-binding universal stress UspA family protein